MHKHPLVMQSPSLIKIYLHIVYAEHCIDNVQASVLYARSLVHYARLTRFYAAPLDVYAEPYALYAEALYYISAGFSLYARPLCLYAEPLCRTASYRICYVLWGYLHNSYSGLHLPRPAPVGLFLYRLGNSDSWEAASRFPQQFICSLGPSVPGDEVS
jgi:hypothetical protein